MKQHKWHKEIKAWADGVEIEFRYFKQDMDIWADWGVIESPVFSIGNECEYRIKPQPVITVEYFQKTSFHGYTCYMAFTPDLEKWDLKITYIDGVVDKVEIG